MAGQTPRRAVGGESGCFSNDRSGATRERKRLALGSGRNAKGVPVRSPDGGVAYLGADQAVHIGPAIHVPRSVAARGQAGSGLIVTHVAKEQDTLVHAGHDPLVVYVAVEIRGQGSCVIGLVPFGRESIAAGAESLTLRRPCRASSARGGGCRSERDRWIPVVVVDNIGMWCSRESLNGYAVESPRSCANACAVLGSPWLMPPPRSRARPEGSARVRPARFPRTGHPAHAA